jgi:hypothetical protein
MNLTLEITGGAGSGNARSCLLSNGISLGTALTAIVVKNTFSSFNGSFQTAQSATWNFCYLVRKGILSCRKSQDGGESCEFELHICERE